MRSNFDHAVERQHFHLPLNDAAKQLGICATAIKKVRAALDAGKPEDAAAALKAAQPVIDSMVNKGIIHKNAAARYKSRLAAGAKKAAAAK